MTRREMLGTLLGGALAVVVLPRTEAEASRRRMTRRQVTTPHPQGIPGLTIPLNHRPCRYRGKLAFHNVHTGDSIDLRYLNEEGQLDGSACKRLSHFFRCHLTGWEVRIDPRLFLFLDALRNGLSADEQPFLLYSGYRSPAYNRLLARRDGHVARNSFHTQGMAADVALAGIPLADLEHLARSLGVGGVGRYGKFVHLDVGPVRHW